MEYKNGFLRSAVESTTHFGSKTLEQAIADARESRRRHLEEIKDHISALSKVTTDTVGEAVDQLKDSYSLSGIVSRRPWYSVGISMVAGILVGRSLGHEKLLSDFPSLTHTGTAAGDNKFSTKSVLRSAVQAGLAELGGIALAASLQMLRDHVEKKDSAETSFSTEYPH